MKPFPFVCFLMTGIWLCTLPPHSTSTMSFCPENFWKLEERVKVSHCLCPSRFPTLQVLVIVLFPTGGSFSWLLFSALVESDFISDKSSIHLIASKSSLTTSAGTQFTLHAFHKVLVAYGRFSPFIPYILNPSQAPRPVLGKNKEDQSKILALPSRSCGPWKGR